MFCGVPDGREEDGGNGPNGTRPIMPANNPSFVTCFNLKFKCLQTCNKNGGTGALSGLLQLAAIYNKIKLEMNSGLIPLNIKLPQDDRTVCCGHNTVPMIPVANAKLGIEFEHVITC